VVGSHAEDFSCPNCNAKYRLVRVEAEPEPSHGRIECYHWGGPLNGREGRFILKYFLIDRPRRQLKPNVLNRSGRYPLQPNGAGRIPAIRGSTRWPIVPIFSGYLVA
jgi:hypothetical protein